MYVIMDLEWAGASGGRTYPTQLAAARVDGSWGVTDMYSELIAPVGGRLFAFDQVGYSGHEREEFLNADCARAVFFRLMDWLRADDVLCWWQGEAAQYFEELCYSQTERGCPQGTVMLRDRVHAFLGRGGDFPRNPYRMAKRLGVGVPGPMHESRSDVTAIALLLAGIGFGQETLLSPAPKKPKGKNRASAAPCPYIVEPCHGVVHRRGCPDIPPGIELREYQTLKGCMRGGNLPCKCCAEEFSEAYIQRNLDVIARSEYNYIFTPRSKVLHSPSCSCMKNAGEILGTVYYGSAARTGRSPCALCRPSPYDAPRPDVYAIKRQAREERERQRTFSKDEQQALERYERAKRERALLLETLPELSFAEKRDRMLLAHPANVFWGAKGYSSFHTRGCPKMRGLCELEGFSRFSDALRAGYKPCKSCKPTAKMDAALSIPIYSRPRENETVQELEAACDKAGFTHTYAAPKLTLRTPVGIWRVDTERRPVPLMHINLVRTPENRDVFHTQPKIFLSLMDAFDYIQGHDRELQENVAQGRASGLPFRGVS